MLEGKEIYSVEDKAVSTSEEFFSNYTSRETECTTLTIDKLLTTLINNKLISLRKLESVASFEHYDSESSIYSLPEQRGKEPPLKKLKQHHEQHGHRHLNRGHIHSTCAERRVQRTSICKVQKWSEDLDMDSFDNNGSDEEISWPHRKINRAHQSPLMERGNVVSDGVGKPATPKHRKKRRRPSRAKKMSRIDPEDLPKRARWTIIITSGLLILTCMFLVGITLRMAPVIDQMVRTKNEELMNSLNRDTESNPLYYYSAEMWDRSPPSPNERAKQKQKYG